MDIVHPAIDRYLLGHAAPDDEPVLLEMEALAREKGFPIIGRLCGRFLEVMARSIGARRIFEMGSGFGYSAYWFARSTGPGGDIHLTDMDPANKNTALDFLQRAGLADPITYHVAPALDAFADADGEFDVVYCDIDKQGYPDAWRAARSRLRVGGLFMCDNMLWSGRVTDESDEPDVRSGWTETIMETNSMIFSDPDYRAFMYPVRDGVITALRVT
ncbi:MAG: O-methyltransferase [Actinomycetota bacterium]